MVEKRLHELAMRAAKAGIAAYTRFLEPSLVKEANSLANAAGAKVDFFGGYPDAERQIAAFYADEVGTFPIECIRLSWNPKYGSPGHRDILGAMMGLGIVRESLGDILVFADYALLFVHTDVTDYILASLESAGRAKLNAKRYVGGIDIPEPDGALSYHTVPSERLDALVAQAFHLSRQEAQKLIRAELVKLNHVVESRTDAKLSQGDLVSVRGLGRFRLAEIAGETRKGRVGVRIFVYGK